MYLFRQIILTIKKVFYQRPMFKEYMFFFHAVIVEEAAEVLEAHITTSLSTTCQHLILIGILKY